MLPMAVLMFRSTASMALAYLKMVHALGCLAVQMQVIWVLTLNCMVNVLHVMGLTGCLRR